MGRISRKTWTMDDFGHLNMPGLFGMFDVAMKSSYRITDEEYDNICDVATDEELNIFLEEKPTFAVKRQMIELLNKYIEY